MFTTSFRPKARVRQTHADDAAVIDPTPPAMLRDSHGAVCVACGHRVSFDTAELMAADIVAHLEVCRGS